MKNRNMPEVDADSLTAAGKQPENEKPRAPKPMEQTREADQTPPETLTQAAPEETEPTERKGAVPVCISPHEPPPRGITPTEYRGLCCLLDRARHYGGENDVIFLCLRGGLLLAQFVAAEEAPPDGHREEGLCARGYLFRNADTQMPDADIWDRLPVWMGLLLEQEPGQPLDPDCIPKESTVFRRFRNREQELWSALHRMKQECVLDIQPKSVGFTRLPFEVYGESGIDWYPITPMLAAEENVDEVPSDAALREQYDADSDIYLTPPSLLRGWRITQNGKKRRADGLLDEIEWLRLQRLLEDLL